MKKRKWWTKPAVPGTSFVALGLALPFFGPSSFFINAGDNNDTVPPQFGRGLNESVFVQMMVNVFFPW